MHPQTHTLLAAPLALLVAAAAAAGDLNPPAGPITPTMKSLDQAEPRVPLTQETTPGDALNVFRIEQPGSYYLVGDVIAGAGQRGVQINADNVTLDLSGFTIAGEPGSSHGVILLGVRNGVSVHDGIVTGCGGNGISAVDDIATNLRGVVVTGCTGSGLAAYAAARITKCAARNNGGVGVRAGPDSVVLATVAAGNESGGIRAERSIVRDCIANNNFGPGILALGSTVRDCQSDENQTGIEVRESDSVVVGNRCTSNGHTGILVSPSSSNSLVDGNHCSSNGVYGIRVEGVNYHLLVRNMAAANGTSNYDIFSTFTTAYGPFVSSAGAITSNSPWANFQD